MKKSKKIILIALLCITLLSISSFTFADVGNVNRYSNNSSSNSSSSSNKKSTSSSTSSSGSSGLGIVEISIGAVVFLVILYFYGKSKGMIKGIKDIGDINKMKEVYGNLKNDLGSVSSTESAQTVRGMTAFEKTMRESDPNFSSEKFLSWASDVFIKLQQAWTARDWKIIRPFESNELFEQHQAQLQEYIDNNKINVIEKISIVESDFDDHYIDGDKEVLKIWIVANLRDYVIDATTKEVLESDPNKDWEMIYFLTFYRKNGVKTKAGASDKVTTNCPNCGAPTQVTSAGECGYCGTVITTGEHDWVLCKLEGSQG